jgi:hypothetical protein
MHTTLKQQAIDQMLALLRELGNTMDFQSQHGGLYAVTPQGEYGIDYNYRLKAARLFKKRLTDKKFKAVLMLVQ